jgi:hypothetical protein
MRAFEEAADLMRWAAETLSAALGAHRPPRRALGLAEDAPTLFAREGDGYRPLRPARAGDRAPLWVGSDDAVAAVAEAPAAAALHGGEAARYAAEAACPFPPGAAALGLAPAPEPWRGGVARWRVAAAPHARLAALERRMTAVGARPGAPFALIDGAAVRLETAPPRGAWPSALAALTALALIGAAHGLLSWRIAAMEDALAKRVAAARAALAARAADAPATADPDLAAAQAAAALLAAAPPAGAALERFTAMLPDAAHAARIAVAPGRIEADIAAEDAAALAARLAEATGVRGARLAQGARIDQATGLQRAAIALDLAASSETAR